MANKLFSSLFVILLIQASLQLKIHTEHQDATQGLNNQKIVLVSNNNRFVSVQRNTNRLFVGTDDVGLAETFFITIAQNGDTHFKSALTNRYLSTEENGQITASAEGVSLRTSFHLHSLDGSPGNVILSSVQNGKFVTGILHEGKHYLSATSESPFNSETVRYVLLHDVSVRSRTHNTYLSLNTGRDPETGLSNTLSFSAHQVGENERFEVVQVDANRLYLRSLKNGLFARLAKHGQNNYLVATEHNIGPNSFTIEETPAGLHLRGSNGLFLSEHGRLNQLTATGDLFELNKL